MKTFLLLFCFALLCTQSKAQTNLYVDSSVTSSGAGTSWATAYKTLNEALNYANPTSTTTQYYINIAKGTYWPTGVQSGTNRDTTFAILRGGIRLYGGYPNGGGARDYVNFPVILDGNISSVADSLDNCYHVVVIANISSASDSVILDGLTVRKAFANGTGSKLYSGCQVFRNEGAGVHTCTVSNKTKLSNLSVSQNYADYGGGARIYSSIPTITHCLFSRNRSIDGGAIYFFGATGTLSNDTFVNNLVSEYGGALYIYENTGVFTISNCLFDNNYSNLKGGAIYTGDNSAAISGTTFNNCTYTNSRALSHGGAIYMDYGFFAANTIGCTFMGNRSLSGNGGGIYSIGSYNINNNVTNCIFSNDSAVYGGGMLITSTAVLNSNFNSNYATNGGGIYRKDLFSTTTVADFSNCKFEGNIATNNGGGLYLAAEASALSFSLKNSVIYGNKANNNGGGVYLRIALSGSTITNVTLAGNAATNGTAIYDSFSSPTILNSIIYGGSSNTIFNFANSNPAISYSLIDGSYPGTGNLNADPKFTNPISSNSAPTAAGDYSLLSCSPAINAGLNSGSYIGVTDVAGMPRLFGTTVDMGAYEYQASPNAAAGTITGNSSVCVNSTIQLNNTAMNGVWSISNANATINSSGLVTGVSSGADTVTYTVNGSTNCSSSTTKIITINAIPTVNPITGNNAICANGTSQLSTTSTGGVWSGNNSPVATVSVSGLVSGVSAGTATVSYTITGANGCSNAAVYAMTVNALPVVPAIVGPTSVCAKNNIQLSNTNSNGVWSSDNAAVASVSGTGQVHGAATGTANIIYTVTDANGCSGQATQAVQVNGVNTNVTQNVNTLTVTQAGTAYQWVNCPSYLAVAGQTGQSFTATANGQYAAVITANGCTDTSACFSITHVFVPGMDFASIVFEIYPNPAKDNITVTTSNLVPDMISVLDITGRELQKLIPTGNETKIDLSAYTAGVYEVIVFKGKNREIKRVSVY